VLTSVLLELSFDACLNRQGRNIVIVLHDEAHCVGLGGNCADELVIAIQVAIHYVLLNRLIKEKRLLLHDRDLVAEVGHRNLLQVLTVDNDLASGTVVESKDQRGYRTLSRARVTHNSHRLIGLNSQIEVA